MTPRGGEVIGLRRSADGLAVRFIGDADAGGRHAAGVLLQARDGREVWRAQNTQAGATRFLARFDGQLAAGGYATTADGRFVPTLELYAAKDGRPARRWRGEAVSPRDALLLGGAQIDAKHAVVLVAEPALRGPAAGRRAQLHLLEVDAALEPRKLVDIDLPAGMTVDEATVTPLGGALLVTYTDRSSALAARPALTEDDYDAPLCTTAPVTRLELRDARTGALRQARDLPGYVVSAATDTAGRLLLGGAHTAGCGGQARGSVLAVDAALATRPVYEDAGLGMSEVRALRALAGGRTLVVANKANVLDYRPLGARADVYAMTDLQQTYSGMLLTLERDGTASAPTMLDTGLNVFLSAAETDGRGGMVVGGSVGGGAALVRLAGAPARPR